jgi:hypothetical protein
LRLPAYAGIGALIIFVSIMVFAADVGEFLYIVVVAPINTLVWLIFAICFVFQKKRPLSLAVLSMLVVYWAVTLGLQESLLNCTHSPAGSSGRKITKLKFWRSWTQETE